MFARRAVKVLRPFITLFHNISRAADLAPGAHRARRAHYTHYIARVVPARRMICFVVCFGLILASVPTLPASIGKFAERSRGRLNQGPPVHKFPNLNEARRMNPGVPKISPPVSAPFASKVDPSAMAPPSMQENLWPMDLLAQVNRVGTKGDDLLSRNYNWATPIVRLPGRAGMDLDLGLSLNSLIWTKSGTNMYFNLDKGFPSVGFHLGFPELGVAFHNTETGTGSYLLTMPSGMRYEFRANPALGSNVYEEMGGTHMLLVVKPGLFSFRDTVWNLLLTEGTVYKFKIATNNPKCVEVKDSNGNFISITYTPFEQISAITDTLNRVVNYKYDGSNRLISIAQDWAGGAHNYATFAYDNLTIQTNFLGLDLVGATNGTTISVLSRVDMADGKVYAFEYNSYAQVKTIRCYAPNSANPENFPDDYTQLSYITYDLTPDDHAGQTDCPRFSSRRDWAKDWSAVTENGAGRIYDGDGVSWGSVTEPDGTMNKEFFGVSGWQRGLTVGTETWSNGSKKKWTTSTWANGDESVSYWLNPRLVETNVYDDKNNRKKTKMDYDDFGAVTDINEYDADASTVLRHTQFGYLRGPAYTGNLNRRLTQLVTSKKVFDGNEALQSKVTNEYDLGDEYLVHQGPPVRHDTAKFGLTFVQGRGNLNVVRRWDVTHPDDPAKSLATMSGYNTSGSMIFSRDPLNHVTKLIYTDSFSDSVNHNTLAYPTMMEDADQFQSTVQYNYDFSAVTRTKDPKQSALVNTYDPIGRLVQATNQVNGAYTRYVYAPNHLHVQMFTTINDLSSEFYQIKVFDGYGRERGAASDHPGSVGGYKAQVSEYDIMRRLARQSNPTEITNPPGDSVNWTPAGDDAAAGWVWKSQVYDWNSRPMVSTNQDGTTRTVSYEGCGCSGGDVVTETNEGRLVGETLFRRKQKIYHDVLGRVVKTEIYNPNDTVYTTDTQAYNALDQTIRITHQAGSGGASQETTFGYDGYGRLSTRQFPNASAPSSFVYNADDTVQMVTDARGAGSSFSYNKRRLVTGITYSAPGEVTATPSVTFGYDEAGNQTSMTDGLGSATYHYDMLSRMDWETRVLNGVGSFTINYAYNLSGQLTGVTDPANDSVTYARNNAGEIDAINGSNYGGVTQYASELKFRAWGGLKAISYGNGLSLTNKYNTRLQLQQMEVRRGLNPSTPSLMKNQYQYHPNGSPKFAQNLIDSRFDRGWTYDDVGRLTAAYTGVDADVIFGVSVPSPQPGPYRHVHQYDVWNNLLSRTGRYWNDTSNFTTTYNERNQREGWTYDAGGNLLNDKINQYIYDATGRNVSAGGVTQDFDGQGQVIKHTDLDQRVTYYLHSTPLGGKVLTELFGTPGGSAPVGAKSRGYVYAEGVVVAKQRKGQVDYTQSLVEWQHQDEVTGSLGVSDSDGIFAVQQEPDPMGVNVGLSAPAPSFGGVTNLLPRSDGEDEFFYLGFGGGGFPDGKCTMDGVDVGCSMAISLLRSGAAALAPQQTTRWNPTTKRFEFFRATQEGEGWTDSKGKWIHEETTSSYTRIATEDVLDEDGNVAIHKGEEIGVIEGGDHWEYSGTEYVSSLTTEEFLFGGGLFQSKTPESKDSKKTKKSCGIKRGPEYNVSGTVTGGTAFTWSARFLKDATHDPKACEVRQLISWNIAPFGGASVPHSGFPAGSQPGVWYEDRDQHNNRYGRRTGPYTDLHPGSDWYQGNRYQGSDQPSGFPAGVNLRFRLIVVDVFNGGKTIYTSRTLTVAF
jgi:YD repeat-containing protein